MSFPVITPSTIDNLHRGPEEEPISFGGKWDTIAGHEHRGGQVEFGGYHCVGEFEEPKDNGTFWNVEQYGPITGIKVNIRQIGLRPDEPAYVYACLQTPTVLATQAGYRMVLKPTEGFRKFRFAFNRKDPAGEWETLAFTEEVHVGPGWELGFVVREGKLEAFYRETSAEEWKEPLQFADATYTSGYVGLGGTGPNIEMNLLEVGPPPEKGGPTSITLPMLV